MKHTLTFIYGVSAVLLLSGTAWGADGERSGQVPNPDKAFIENAVAGGRAEVQMGHMASQKATDPAVRDFATQMTQDHQKANDQLTRILADKGITEPESTTETANMSDQLQNQSGADFDRAYMRDMVQDHQKDIAEFKNEAANGKDPEIRAWAAQTLPVLEEHLQLAEKTESNLK